MQLRNLLVAPTGPYRRLMWMAAAWWELIDSPTESIDDRSFLFWAALSRGCSFTDPPAWDQWCPTDPGLVKLSMDILQP